VDWIRLLNTLDYLVIVVTNQRGIARGIMTNADVEAIHTRMIEALAAKHAHIDDVYYCPHDKNSCNCRKPAPGMVLAAQAKWNINLSESLMIGDSDSDQGLAANCGLRFLRAFQGRFV
jgi:histidinol-phosphate phosphatase family protein